MLDGIRGLVVKTGNRICASEEKVLSLQQEAGLDVIQSLEVGPQEEENLQ